MKPFIMLLLLAAASCTTTNVEAIEHSPVVTNTRVIPTSTRLPPTSVPPVYLPTPSSAHTATVGIPCDPLRADYCITDGHFFLQRPIRPPANDRVDPTYRYASTANGTRDPHRGVEFVNASGTSVHAAAEGTIRFAGPDEEATYAPWPNYYGNLVVIEHTDDLFTLYAHLSRVDVQPGQQVLAGDKIGEVGRTGVAIGSHLHFEVRRGNGEDYFATQNPELWLIPAKDTNGELLGVVLLSLVDESHTPIEYAEFTLQSYLDRSQPPVKSYYGTTYVAEMLTGDENAVLGELPAGQYRLTLQRNGQLHERWVEVESGRLTQVVLIVN